MIEKTELELIEIPLSRLLKLELPEFAERIINLVEAHNPEELKIKEMHDLLVAEEENIKKLVVGYGAHPLTEELSRLREVRSLHVREIELNLKVVSKKDNTGTNKDVRLAKIEINRFLGDLRSSKNDQTISRKITQFFEEVSTNAELQTALTSLNFTEDLDNLKAVHKSIQEVTAERSRSISGRPKEKTAQLVKSVLTATKDLMKQIEIAPKKHPELDYTSLYNELNDILIEYRDLINRRMLFNKKKAEELNSGNGESTETTNTTQDTESAGRMLYLNAENRNMNVQETEQIENEDAAAMPAKTMQLPLVDEKGEFDEV